MPTLPKITKVSVVRPYVLSLEFASGEQGEVDLEGELWGEVFEPLKDRTLFSQVRIEGGTVAWSNGADFAPEFLHARLKRTATA
ncbi:MAG: DUF2442 domain-containing protein [Chloroflexi bacterium]|nr:DUF2442 domain-containing protein [Chloroflexota bacterium]